jgi:hypothetical protein
MSLPSDDPIVTLDPERNVFVVSSGQHSFSLSPLSFEKLLREMLDATARHVTAALKDTQSDTEPPLYRATPALRVTGITAGADLGAVNILTTVRMGALGVTFVCPQAVAVEYCSQVMNCIQSEGAAPKQRPN